MNKILGLHHITAIASDAQRNYDFYTQTLGFRLNELPRRKRTGYHEGLQITLFAASGGELNPKRLKKLSILMIPLPTIYILEMRWELRERLSLSSLGLV